MHQTLRLSGLIVDMDLHLDLANTQNDSWEKF